MGLFYCQYLTLVTKQKNNSWKWIVSLWMINNEINRLFRVLRFDCNAHPAGGVPMNPAQLKEAIFNTELPSSEASRLVDELVTCPHFCEGKCDIVDICDNQEAQSFYSEVDEEKF